MAMHIADDRANDILEDMVRRVRSIKGGPGIRVVNGPTGITIALESVGAGATPIQNIILPGGASSGNYVFPVLVKCNGTTGPTYDVYALSDSSMLTPLNLTGPIAPINSRARWQSAVLPTPAPDGSEGTARYDLAGAIGLIDCQETLCTSA